MTAIDSAARAIPDPATGRWRSRVLGVIGTALLERGSCVAAGSFVPADDGGLFLNEAPDLAAAEAILALVSRLRGAAFPWRSYRRAAVAMLSERSTTLRSPPSARWRLAELRKQDRPSAPVAALRFARCASLDRVRERLVRETPAAVREATVSEKPVRRRDPLRRQAAVSIPWLPWRRWSSPQRPPPTAADRSRRSVAGALEDAGGPCGRGR